jgi:hypothetical protein
MVIFHSYVSLPEGTVYSFSISYWFVVKNVVTVGSSREVTQREKCGKKLMAFRLSELSRHAAGDLVGDFIYFFMFKHSFGMIPDDKKIMGLESEPTTWLQVSLVWALRCDSFLGRIALLGGGYAQQSCR